MQEGFAERAADVQDLLVAETTGFVLVTTPTTDAQEEAAWFTEHLLSRGVRPTAAVVNRCHPSFTDVDVPTDPSVQGRVRAQLDVLRLGERTAREDAEVVAAIARGFGAANVSAVPMAAAPARDVVGIGAIADDLAR
jgi:anion-transporting  ArsA/GET3 family ATPase